MKIERQYQTTDVRVTITIQSTTLDADKWMRKADHRGQWDARDMAKACAEDVQRAYDQVPGGIRGLPRRIWEGEA